MELGVFTFVELTKDPLAIAIIGGQPRQFAPLAQLYRSTAADAGHAEAPIAITSHTFVGDTSQGAADTFYDHYRTYLHTMSRSRFRIDRDGYEAGRGLEGALFVGSPDQVVEKILHQHEMFGHQRFLAQISLGSVPHADAMRGIELLGSKVLPAVRAALG